MEPATTRLERKESALSTCLAWATNAVSQLFLSSSLAFDPTLPGSETAARGKMRGERKQGRGIKNSDVHVQINLHKKL